MLANDSNEGKNQSEFFLVIRPHQAAPSASQLPRDVLMGALLDQFATAGVRFEQEEAGNLRALGTLTEELRPSIRMHKPAILAELAANDVGTANPGQRQELREVIAIVLEQDTEAERTETLAAACADPEAALISFRALVADLQDPWSRA